MCNECGCDVCAGSSEMKYKLYGSVLVIGGGLAFQGAASMLQSRLELQLPTLINRSSQTVEVFSNPRVSVCTSSFLSCKSFFVVLVAFIGKICLLSLQTSKNQSVNS